MTKFSFDEAKARLDTAHRETLADHAFGDAEVYWMLNGENIAGGYYGRTSSIDLNATDSRERTEFHGEDADRLRYRGKSSAYTRNDTTGEP